MSSRLSKWIFSILLLSLLLVGCNGSESKEKTAVPLEPVLLRLNWEHGTQFLGFYVAQAKGFYADEGLAVTIEPASDSSESSVLPGWVAEGKVDFGLGTINLVQAQAKGVPVTAIAAIYRYGPAALFARADSGIVTPADLAGRRVVIKGPYWQVYIEQLLAHEGMTLDDIIMIPGGFDMTPFFEGQVDVWAGYITNEVVRARLRGIEVVTLPLYEYGIDTNSSIIITSRASLAEKPDRAVRFLRASLRGWIWAVDHSEEAVNLMLAMFPDMVADQEFAHASFEASIPLIRPPGTRVGSIDCDLWRSNELLAGLDSKEGLCTTEVLEAVWASE